ncbi:unnamed protein product, partial [Closterium sp. NIES-54]
MDAEMASWKSTGTYVDAVPPSRANIVDGMWIFRVKRTLGSPLAFKARYVSRSFSQRVTWELKKRHTCTDLGELRSYLGLHITRDRARHTIILTQSHMGHQVLQRFGFQFSSQQPTPLSAGHSLSAPPSDESVEPSEATALGASETALRGAAPAVALHTFRLDSGASRCFFRDSTTLTPLSTLVPVRLADPSGGPVLAYSSTVLPCPVAPPCSCRLLSHQALLWHHRLGHLSLPRLRGMHSHLLVSRHPRSLPPLPPSPAPPCLPCVEGRQRTAPHSSFPPTTASLQTLHMDVWGPARVSGQGRERYFLLVVEDYTRYNTVFLLRSKGEVVDVLIPWIRAVRLQLRERFRQDLPVLHLHSDRGGEFSSDLLRDFCRGEGILQSFTLPNSPQQNRIVERRISLVME